MLYSCADWLKDDNMTQPPLANTCSIYQTSLMSQSRLNTQCSMLIVDPSSVEFLDFLDDVDDNKEDDAVIDQEDAEGMLKLPQSLDEFNALIATDRHLLLSARVEEQQQTDQTQRQATNPRGQVTGLAYGWTPFHQGEFQFAKAPPSGIDHSMWKLHRPAPNAALSA